MSNPESDAAITIPLAGCSVGHWHDRDAWTGCTVVLLPSATIASGDIRGGSPATREFALLDPVHRVEQLDALVLCGGSAFGLDAAQGVVRFCEENGRGFPTAHGAVPIVVGLALYDLGVGRSDVRPTAADGYRAAKAATAAPSVGRVGAGCGAPSASGAGTPMTKRQRSTSNLIAVADSASLLSTTTTLSSPPSLRPTHGGDIDTAGVPNQIAIGDFDQWPTAPATSPAGTNTTIGIVVTNADLSKVGCNLVAQSAHDGLARAVFPAHTSYDGDAFVAAATGEVVASIDQVRAMATVATEQAIRMVGPAPG